MWTFRFHLSSLYLVDQQLTFHKQIWGEFPRFYNPLTDQVRIIDAPMIRNEILLIINIKRGNTIMEGRRNNVINIILYLILLETTLTDLCSIFIQNILQKYVLWVGRAYFNTFFFHDINSWLCVPGKFKSHNIMAFLFWHESLLWAANTDINSCTILPKQKRQEQYYLTNRRKYLQKV